MAWRLSGIAGLLFVALSFFAVGINAQPPFFDGEYGGLAAWFAGNGPRYRFGHFVAGLAFLLFYFPFFAGLCEKLRLAEGAPAIGSRMAWAGAILSPAAGTVSGSGIIGVALLGDRVSPDMAAFGTAVQFYAYVVAGGYGGVVLLGASWVILRTGVFLRWLGWVGILTGAAAIGSTAAIVEGNPSGWLATLNGIAWLAYFLWMAALSIELIRGTGVRPAWKADTSPRI